MLQVERRARAQIVRSEIQAATVSLRARRFERIASTSVVRGAGSIGAGCPGVLQGANSSERESSMQLQRSALPREENRA